MIPDAPRSEISKGIMSSGKKRSILEASPTSVTGASAKHGRWTASPVSDTVQEQPDSTAEGKHPHPQWDSGSALKTYLRQHSPVTGRIAVSITTPGTDVSISDSSVSRTSLRAVENEDVFRNVVASAEKVDKEWARLDVLKKFVSSPRGRWMGGGNLSDDQTSGYASRFRNFDGGRVVSTASVAGSQQSSQIDRPRDEDSSNSQTQHGWGGTISTALMAAPAERIELGGICPSQSSPAW